MNDFDDIINSINAKVERLASNNIPEAHEAINDFYKIKGELFKKLSDEEKAQINKELSSQEAEMKRSMSELEQKVNQVKNSL